MENLTIVELEDLIKNATEILTKKKSEVSGKYTLSWDSGVQDTRKHGKPYLCKITGVGADGKFEREFMSLAISWGKNSVQVYGDFEASEGDILEAREGGSWKNEYRYFYLVRNGEMVHICDATTAAGKKKVADFIGGKISVEELTK